MKRAYYDPGDQNVHRKSGKPEDPNQAGLFPPPDVRFDGDDYVDARDRVRLRGQILRVYELMADGRWRTLSEIATETGDPEASVSAQLRHLRKKRFGLHNVEKRHRGEPASGLYEYRIR